MPLVHPVGTSECAMYYKLASDTENYTMTFGLSHAEPPSLAALGTLFTALANALNDQMSNAYTWVGWKLEYFSDDPDPDIFEGSLSIVGARTTAVDKQNVCVLIRKNTAIGGRAGKGRMYVSGVINGDATDAGVLTTTARTNWQTAVDAFFGLIDNETADGYRMVLFHDVDASHPLYGEATDVNNLTVQSTLATQRRRLRR